MATATAPGARGQLALGVLALSKAEVEAWSLAPTIGFLAAVVAAVLANVLRLGAITVPPGAAGADNSPVGLTEIGAMMHR